MDHRACLAALAATLLPVATAAYAKDVRYPAAHPEVALQVPDDWSVAETPLGLELQSPEKDALVVAGVTAGDRKSVDGWSKRALERMSGEGVVFAKAGTKAAKPHVAGPDGAPAGEAAKAPSAPQAPPPAAADVAKANGDKPYTFGGTPLVDPLGTAQKEASKLAGTSPMPSISTEGLTESRMKPIGHYAYSGTLRGQPVDVELAVFPLDKTKRLLIEQLSGATDARGVMIVRSLRNLTP